MSADSLLLQMVTWPAVDHYRFPLKPGHYHTLITPREGSPLAGLGNPHTLLYRTSRHSSSAFLISCSTPQSITAFSTFTPPPRPPPFPYFPSTCCLLPPFRRNVEGMKSQGALTLLRSRLLALFSDH